jgi:hypothetical protein
MALSGPRATPRRSTYFFEADAPVGANAVLWQGAMAVLNAAGFLVPASTATGLRKPCLVDHDNGKRSLVGGAANGDVRCRIFFTIALYKNSSAGDLIVAADRGNPCFIVDDETVAKTDGSGARSAAGQVVDVDSEGVWVLQAR